MTSPSLQLLILISVIELLSPIYPSVKTIHWLWFNVFIFSHKNSIEHINHKKCIKHKVCMLLAMELSVHDVLWGSAIFWSESFGLTSSYSPAIFLNLLASQLFTANHRIMLTCFTTMVICNKHHYSICHKQILSGFYVRNIPSYNTFLSHTNLLSIQKVWLKYMKSQL